MRYDAAVLDREYNNRELVPDWAEHVGRWKRDSQEARLNWPCLLDLPYGESIAQTLDWFAPAATGLAPCLVFIHGGWWRSLDKADHSFIAPAYVARGVHMVALNYSLAPGASMQQIVLDVVQALAWVWRRAEDFGVDRSRIVLAGHSAGAHLAAMMLACRFDWYGDDLPRQIPSGALALSGVYDLESVRKTAFLQRDLKLTQHAARAMSPAWLPPSGPAPLALAVGENESAAFHVQARLMHRHWPQTGKTLIVPGAHHFSALDALSQPGTSLHTRMCDLLGTRKAGSEERSPGLLADLPPVGGKENWGGPVLP
jgi:arylformamidase